MARAISDEEIQLRKRARRRLIGAVILVAAVVVVLPMVLDPEPRAPSQDINIRIPAPDATAFSPKMTPMPAVVPETKSDAAASLPVQKTAPPVATPPASVQPESRPEPPAKAPKPSATPPSKQAAALPSKTAPDKAPKAAPEPGQAKSKSQEYVLQVIALADADRAKQMQKQIAAAGIKSYTEVVSTEKGPVTRVRVGPFSSQEAAEKARGRLQGMGLDAKVVPK